MKLRLWKIQFYWLIYILAFNNHNAVFSQNNEPVICNGSLIEVLDGKLSRLQLNPELGTFSREHFLNTTLDLDHVSALGFRWADQKFYGAFAFAIDTVKIFSLDLDGSHTIITTFVTESPYRIVSGAVTNDQQYLVMLEGRDTDLVLDASKPTFLHKINLENGLFTHERTTITTTGVAAGVFVGDIAFDPITNLAYGFDDENSRFITIDINSGTVDNTSLAVIDIPFDLLCSIFFDPFGRLFAADKNPAGVFLMEIDKVTGTVSATLIENAPPGTPSAQDGCSCPFTVALEQTLSIDTSLNCQEIEAVINIAYLSEVSTSGLTFRDSFPPNCIVKEVLRNPYGGEINGVGTNIISINNIFPPYGIDSIKLKLFIEEDVAEGNYLCQASISGLDLSAANDSRTTIYSDYPTTSELHDPTPFYVKNLEAFIPNTAYELCPNATISLQPIDDSFGLSFLWPDGSTADSYNVDTPGSYDVVIGNGCSEETFSLNVTRSLLEVNLGEDQAVFPGQTVLLEPEIVDLSAQQHTYQWISNDTTALECMTCAENLINPRLDITTVGVIISNQAGCTAEDEINIRLTRPVYVPNVFSPNNDGINDHFFAQTPEPVNFDYFRVFDRWGGLVFEQKEGATNDSQDGWDGRKKGAHLGSGVYVWTIALRYPGDVVEIISGDILLLLD